jgi:ankyrin repeat protein
MKHILITTIAAVLVVGCGPPKPPDISIHEAVEKGNIEAVKQHLAAGTDVNAREKWGVTPLHWAANWGHKEIAERLIAAGADVNAKDKEGWTPLDLADDKETADLLRKHGGKTGAWLNADNSIHSAAKAGHIEAVKQHIATGADVNAKDNDGWIPLHYAALDGHKEVVELLIAEGAVVNAKMEDGDTALDMADGEIADLLRKHGGKTGEELKAEGK